MRRLSLALRSTLSAAGRAIDVEGALILAGLSGIAYVAWTLDWRLGVGVVSTALLVAGIALARPLRTG